MLISLDWIKDFVNIPTDLTDQQIGERITLATAEVEQILAGEAFLEEIKVVERGTCRGST